MLHDPFLKKLGALERLSDAERAAAAALCDDVRHAPRRRDIISEGHDPEFVHVVLNGWAARYNVQKDGSRRITAFLLPGDFCDIHVTILREMDHSILALTDCEVAYVTSDRMDAITRSTPALTRAFWRATLVDEAVLRRWLVKGGRADAFEAVAHLLCELHVRARLVGLTNDHRFSLPVTQEEIGDATGLTPVHVNRVLRRLREAELVTLKQGVLDIHDMDALRRESGFNPNYLHLRDFDARA